MLINCWLEGDSLTRGKYDTKEPIISHSVAALFGYLVRCNNQIHDFQNKAIKEFLERKGISYSYVHDVIFFKEDAVSFEKALSELGKESVKVRTELFFYLVVVSETDGVTDFEEKIFFDKIIKTGIIPNYNDVTAAAKKKAATERKRFKKENSLNHTGKRANPNSKDNLFRITQKEYVNAISHCRKIAETDYKTVKPIVDSIVDEGKNFYSNLSVKLKNNVDFHPEVVEALESFSKAIETQVLNEVKSFQYEFAKKETTVEDFTIALIGKTKAGKSTLRAVLTGCGKENIGSGAQRTTRINDIYEWNHLRIIDTPGIDAGSDRDDEDQKIAEKVIGESDIICYVASTDGLPKNTREFAVNLAKRNKPVIVLLNCKMNISGGARLRRFIENPTEWLQADNENKIEGYFYPIRRLAEENGVSELISCKAVFLYGELMSKDERYSEYAKILSDNSGVNEFLVSLKDAVVNKGAFLRSKTIIDDTVTECLKWTGRVRHLMSPIETMHNSLSAERKNTETKIKKSQDRLLFSATKAIKNAYNKLATVEASTFAEENHTEKGDISKKWENHCKNINFYEKLEKEIEKEFQSFSDEISAVVNDLFEDLQFEFPDMALNTRISNSAAGGFPFKELFTFAGAGLSVAGTIALIFLESNPVGWVLTAAGLVIGLVSGLFKNKAKRQQERKNKLYNKINSAVESQGEKFLKEAISKLRSQSNDCVSQVMGRYDELLSGLSFTSSFCDDLINIMSDNIDTLNVCFAERITEYISGKAVAVSNVEREYGKYLKIYTTEYIDPSICDFGKTKGLLNEEVTIINIGEV